MRTNANAVWNTLVLTVHELKKKKLKGLRFCWLPLAPKLPDILATE